MTPAAVIVPPAQGEGWWEIIILLIVVGISAVGGIIQRWLQKVEEQRKAREKREKEGPRYKPIRPPGASEQSRQTRARPGDPQRTGTRYRPIAQYPQQQEAQPRRQPPPPPPRRADPEPAPPQPDIGLQREAERIFRTGAHEPSPEPTPSGSPFPQPDAVVIETVDRAQQRAAERKAQRRAAARRSRQKTARKAAHPKPPAAEDVRATELGSGRRRAGASPAAATPEVDLSSPAEARKAIIYSEILGPPKALRQGEELWER